MDLNDHLHRLETTGPNVENVGNVSSEQRYLCLCSEEKYFFFEENADNLFNYTMLFFDSSPYYAGMKIASIAEKNRICILYFLRRVLRILRGWGRPNVNSDIFTTVPIVDL